MSNRSLRRFKRGSILALLFLFVIGAGWLIKNHPPDKFTFYPRCQLHQFTGLHCPGCGMTRGVHALLNCEIEQAIAWHPLILILLPIILVAAIRSLLSWLIDRPAPAEFRPSSRWRTYWMPILLMIMLTLFGIVRNLPWEPFSRLAPHELSR